MIRSEEQWQKLYQNYVKSYDTDNAKMISKYGYGYYSEKYSYRAYKNTYMFLEAYREEQREAGTRKVLNVQRDLIAAQKFRYTAKQARGIAKKMQLEAINKWMDEKISKKEDISKAEYRKEMAKIKRDITFTKVRTRQIRTGDFWEDAKAKYKELGNYPGISGKGHAKERQMLLSQYLFPDSPA